MPKYVSFDRLKRGVGELAEWRGRVNSQGAVHLWQFLALRRSGVTTTGWTRHEEAADQAFWDRVMRVRAGPEPYYDPLTGKFRIESHFHSNVATARKNTFKNRWRAASVNPADENEWQLDGNYLDTLISKAWT